MPEIVLALGLAFAGIVVAVHFARWVSSRHDTDTELTQLASRVRVAAEGFARRQAGSAGAISALMGGALFLAFGLRTTTKEIVSPLELGVWVVGSFALGASGALACAQLSAWLSARAAPFTASAARHRVDDALRVAARGGAATALTVCAAATLVLSVPVALAAIRASTSSMDAANRAEFGTFVPWLLVGCPLGACVMSLLVQLSGGSFAKSADGAADLGGREAGLEEDDANNPAGIASLAGDAIDSGARAAHGFATAVTEDVAAMLVLALAFGRDTSLRSVLSLIALPLLSRAFGILAAAFGVFALRTDEREEPSAALQRAHRVATVLHAVGFAGAVEWLVPHHRWLLLSAGACGLASSACLTVIARAITSPRTRAVRELAEASRAGPSFNLLHGLSVGLDVAVAVSVAILVTTTMVWMIGRSADSPAGIELAFGALLAGASGGAPMVLALELAGAASDGGAGLVAMTIGRHRREVRGRMLVLEGAGALYRVLGRIRNAASASLLVVPCVLALRHEAQRRAPSTSTNWTDDSALPIFVGSLLGAALVVWLASRGAVATARATKRVLDEVQRQLRDRPSAPARSSNHPHTDRAPDTEPCVELAARLALRQLFLGAAAISLPVGLVVVLHLVPIADKGRFTFVAAVSHLTAAATVGAFGALFACAAGSALSSAKRYIVTGAHGGRLLVDETGARAENPTYYASVVGDVVGDPLKDVAGPTIVALVQLLPILALTILPLIL
jgi:K(+)-stimulated pyrophosphate-energized sodium pump